MEDTGRNTHASRAWCDASCLGAVLERSEGRDGMTEDRDRVVRGWGWPPRRRKLGDLGRWPYRVGICAALATTVGIISLLQRDALDPPQWAVIALIALAVLPWIVDLLLVEVPPWLFAPAVLVPVAILYDPTQFDPLPFLLAVLVLDMALWLGFRGSAPVLLISALVVLWQLRDAPVGDPGWLARPLVSIGAGWLVGLALHSQVQRVSRLRGSQRALVERAVTDERERIGRVVRESATRRAHAMLAGLHTSPDATPQADSDDSSKHLMAAERLAREIISDLQRDFSSSSDHEDRA